MNIYYVAFNKLIRAYLLFKGLTRDNKITTINYLGYNADIPTFQNWKFWGMPYCPNKRRSAGNVGFSRSLQKVEKSSCTWHIRIFKNHLLIFWRYQCLLLHVQTGRLRRERQEKGRVREREGLPLRCSGLQASTMVLKYSSGET